MSYSRRFSKTFSVPYSGTVIVKREDFKENDTYVRKKFEGYTEATVDVNVDVDTDQYDSNIKKCNHDIDTLTGSVVATEVAQIEQVKKNAEQVSEALIDGFFNTINFDISSQITELSKKVESLLLHLQSLMSQCQNKKKQMESDYHILTQRNTKLFNDLNSELEHRVYELNKQAFSFKKNLSNCTDRTWTVDTGPAMSAITGLETAKLDNSLAVSKLKHRASEMLESCLSYLKEQKRYDTVLESTIGGEYQQATYYVPVCYLDAVEDRDRDKSCCVHGSLISKTRTKELSNIMSKQGSVSISDSVKMLMGAEIQKHYTNTDPHTMRVIQCINDLINRK